MTAQPGPLFDHLPVEGSLAESDAFADAGVLNARLDADGYLFFRSLVEPQRLLEVRRDILALCLEAGWLDATAPLMEGVYSGRPFPDANEYLELYRRLILLDSFNRLSSAPELLTLFAHLLGGEVLVHRRNIARISFPQHSIGTTQPHQDFFYIRGSPATYTTWIPLGDCPRDLGGLAIAEGSNHDGWLTHEPASGPGGYGVRIAGRWLTTDYRAGDVVLFHSYTVHGSLHNGSVDRVRLSVDYRYQRRDLPVDPGSMLPHVG
jgi:phytanoyl-CoA dioxygenase PhyH